MAFNAKGEWVPEDDSTSGKMNGLLATDGPLMKQAETAGVKKAAARGLGNSSIAVGAAQDSLYGVATPIAQADANAVLQKNVTGMNNKNAVDMQTADLASRATLQAGQIASSEKMQGIDVAAQNDRLAQSLGSQATLQAAQLASQKELQGLTLSAQERQQVTDLNAARERLGIQNEATASLSANQIRSNETLNANGLLSNERMQNAQLASGERVSTDNRQSSERVAAAQIASNDRERAAAASASAQSSYATLFDAISGNKDIPVATRTAYLTHIQKVNDSNMSLVEQLYGVDLAWSSGSTATGATGLGPALRR